MRNLRFSSLKSFESAARNMSFKLAAEELHVTPTAVSHQVKSLELQLDCRLFVRKTRQVQLTTEGQELFVTLKKAFDDIDDTASRVKSRRSRDVVTLGLGPIIGTRWLAPRLGDFWSRHRDIDLRLHHSAFPMRDRVDHFDLAIAWGDGHWPGMQVTPFISIQVTPVLAMGARLPEQASDLLDHALIHERDRRGWRQWFHAAGVDQADDSLGTVIDDANLVLQTALDGQGVALGILPFVEEELNTGRLLRPFELAIDPGQAYYLIHRKSSLDKSSVNLVRDWLLGQIADH
jgi:LysR family glycine cleavage system transcriptional activator